MDTSKHIGFWFSVLLAMFFVSPLYRDEKSMEDFVTQELQLTRSVFGDRLTDWLTGKAELAYKVVPADAIGSAAVKGEGMHRTEVVMSKIGTGLMKVANGYLYRLVTEGYVAVLRFFILGIWLLMLGPVLVAAVIDGFSQRAVKRAEFGAIRPAAYALASLIVVPLGMSPLFYLLAPFPINPLVTPLWTLVTALPLALLVSNMQPIFGRN